MYKKFIFTLTLTLFIFSLLIPKSFAETDLSGIDAGFYKYKFDNYDIQISKNPDNIMPYLKKADLLLIFNKQQKAKELYKKAFELAKDEQQKAYISSMILYCDGEFDKASDILNSLIKDYPKNERALFTLGLIALNKSDNDKALEYFQKAVDLDNNFLDALNQIGWIYLNKADYDKAIKYFNQVLYRDPYSLKALDGKGYALFKLELYKEALSYIQEVIILVPDSWGSWASLGEIYYSEGQLALAKYCLDKAIAINPDAIEVKILDQKLKPLPTSETAIKKEVKEEPEE